MKNNKKISALIKKDIVSRLESSVIKEINDFEKTKEDTNSSFSKVHESINNLDKELQKTKHQMQFDLKDVLDRFISEKQSLKDEFEDQRRYMKTNVLECKEHINKVNNVIEGFVSKEDQDKNLSEIKDKLEISDIKNHDYSEKVKSLIQDRCKEIENRFYKKFYDYAVTLNNLNDEIDRNKNKIDEFQVNTDGFSRELLIYKKTVFIMQKQIEDLYTQIERLKGR